ncbi:potassium transporter [Lysinibacillus piscis]|uniref:Pilus assembly protein PilO n=1 Tax=Lysinibacillus piscis TaxID=2518931 RepID=A0ABQ5NGT5_9BACI|nr:potassium transporter [Lysinibacillus sp. KH24]GLC87259.1 hypothetical protein LYSBPC_03860 [Lysinibacillus sp. KH24]
MFSNKNSAPILLSALVLVLLFALYYFIVLPKKDEVQQLQNNITVLQQDMTNLQTQITMQKSTEKNTLENVFALQKKVPKDKDIAKLLLNLEEIELLSTSRIVGMQFNNYDAIVNESTLQDPSQPAEEEQANSSENETAEPPTSTIAIDTLPPELQMMTFNIDMAAMDADKLTIFLKELEALERVIRIDHVELALSGEEAELAETAPKAPTAKIQATTFYYEGE